MRWHEHRDDVAKISVSVQYHFFQRNSPFRTNYFELVTTVLIWIATSKVLTEIGLKKFAFMTAPTQEESPEDAQKREELYKQSCAGLRMKFVKWIWNLSTFFSVAPSLSPVALDVAVVLEGVTCAELEVYEAHMVVRCAIAEVGSDGAASAPGSRRFHHYGVTAHMLLSRRWNH